MRRAAALYSLDSVAGGGVDGGSVGLLRPSSTPLQNPPPARKKRFRRCAISERASNSRALAAASFLACAFSRRNRWFSS